MTTKNPEEMTDDELEAAENAARGETAETTEETTGETTTGEGDGTTTTETGTSTEQQEQTTTTEQTGQAGTTDTTTTAEQAAAQTSAGAEIGKVAGVASKDGTRVLPYSALQAERRSARQAAARAERVEKENERLKQEIEDLRAGKSKDSGELTEEEVQRMEADFPEVGAKMRKAFEAQEEARKAAATKTEDAVDEVGDDPVQEAIDQVPLLVEWQHDAQHKDKWQRAVAIDDVLKGSPKWKGKDPVERFTRVAEMVAEEFDIEVPKQGTQQASSKQQQAQQAPAAKKAVESATRQPPSTLSDLKGGSVPDHGQADLTKMPPQRMLQRFMDMDTDAIDRELAKLG